MTNEYPAEHRDSIAQRVREQLSALGEEVALGEQTLDSRTAIVRNSFEQVTIQQTVLDTDDPVKHCTSMRVLEVTGNAVTSDDGSERFALSRFVCPSLRDLGLPVTVLATARTAEPVYLTATGRLLRGFGPNAGTVIGVGIRVFAWGPDGSPRPGIPFTFRVMVPGAALGGEVE